MATADKAFYGEVSKGYIFKVMIDILCGHLQRAFINIDKDGLILRQSDTGNTVLYDIDLPRKNFRGFRCTNAQTISVNLKHLQSLLRNVKKKDSVAMFIDSQYPNKFFITIRPDGVRKNNRFETNSIVYQREQEYNLLKLPEGKYKYPMVIEASDFQKIKRLTSMGKIINVTIQKNNYLSFKCDAGVVYDSELGFGELTDEPDSDVEIEKPKTKSKSKAKTKPKAKAKKNGECQLCDRSISECDCECSVCGNYLTECECDFDLAEDMTGYDKVEKVDIKGLFKAQYYSNILSKLVKLPGLCTQMQFYAPAVEHFPLRIEVNAGQGGFMLGTIQIFIKDINQITFEESINSSNDIVISEGSKKNKKKQI